MISLYAIKNSSTLPNSVYTSLYALVSDSRKTKASQFLRKEDAYRCIIGEVLATYSIALLGQVSFNSIFFETDTHGKPFVLLQNPVQFNISHSGSWVICAVDCTTVGIDVEHIAKPDLAIAKRFFHAREYMEMMDLEEKQRINRFYDLWTLKESYVKAIGKGLSCSLDSFSVFWEDNRIVMNAKDDLPIMNFKQYVLDADYKCSVCASGNSFPDNFTIMTPEELVAKVQELG